MYLQSLIDNLSFLKYGVQAFLFFVDFIKQQPVEYALKGKKVVAVLAGTENLPRQQYEALQHIIIGFWHLIVPHWFRLIVLLPAKEYDKLIENNEYIHHFVICIEASERKEINSRVFSLKTMLCQVLRYSELVEDAKALDNNNEIETLVDFVEVYKNIVIKHHGIDAYSRIFAVLLTIREPMPQGVFQNKRV